LNLNEVILTDYNIDIICRDKKIH